MNEAILLEILSRSMWTAARVSAPILITAIAIGVAVGLLQSITQIQEQTLTFVPKFVAIGVVLIISGSWMLRTLVDYTRELIVQLPSYL